MGNSEISDGRGVTMHVWGPVEDSLARLVRQHEGLRLEPYRDTRGNWTIGYGHRMAAGPIPGYRISEQHADMLLRADICVAIANVDRWLDGRGCNGLGVEGARWAVLVDLAFNVGFKGLCGFHRLRAAVIACSWGRAAAELQDSRWAVQVRGRATVDAEIMRTGQWPWKNAGAS